MLGLRLQNDALRAKAQADGAVDAESVAVESLGSRLRAQREALQLDVQAVCDKLHVRCAVIEALEADDYARAGTPMVYLRGYARNYARFLNPDSAILAQWLEEVGRIGEGDVLLNKRRVGAGLRRSAGASIRPWFNPRWLPWFAVALVVIVVVFLLQPSSKNSMDQPAEAVSSVEPQAEDGAEQVQSSGAGVGSLVDGATAAAKEGEVGEISPVMQAPATPRGTLRLEFTDRSWTQVEDGLGRVLEKRTVEAGSTNRYEGVLPFRVTLGNAVYVRVYFNDQEYDHLNDITDNNIARFQLGASEAQ